MKNILMIGAAALALTACGDKAKTEVKAAAENTTQAVKTEVTDRTAGYSATKTPISAKPMSIHVIHLMLISLTFAMNPPMCTVLRAAKPSLTPAGLR